MLNHSLVVLFGIPSSRYATDPRFFNNASIFKRSQISSNQIQKSDAASASTPSKLVMTDGISVCKEPTTPNKKFVTFNLAIETNNKWLKRVVF